MMERLQEFVKDSRVAYFSMEIALASDIPTYAGGLGVLAGDTMRSCADLKIPIVGVTLVSKKGYFKQDITEDGRQLELPNEWDVSKFAEPLPAEVTVRIQDRDVKVRSWLYKVQSLTERAVPVILLDTDVDGNTAEDREITHYLYGGDESYRLKQEVILGIAGLRMLGALGFNIRKYHMNEGHASLLTLELLKKHEMNADRVKESCVFTTHTPVESGHDKFSHDLVRRALSEMAPLTLDTVKKYGGQDRLNMTLLALNLSRYINGVAKIHGETSKKMFPGYEIHAITNGVHPYTWVCEGFREVYDRHFPGWANEPDLLVRAGNIPHEEIWRAHAIAKRKLIDYVKKSTGTDMSYDVLTLGFARRATGYKRVDLMTSDVERLKKINRRWKVQVVFSGKSHPKDDSGKRVIAEIFRRIRQLKGEINIAYLKNYDMELAAKLVSGSDIWLNTPLPPFEASGTSGMKAAFNGAVNFGVLDGWWTEGWIEGFTGWSIGPHPSEQISTEERRTREVDDLYNKLDYLVAPTFYNRRDSWIWMMKHSIEKIAYYFNTHRMMRRYVTEAYL